MSSKISWTRLNTDQWLFKLSDLPPMEVNVYVKLRIRMLHTREPLLNDSRVLSHFTCCTVKRFEKALDYLFRSGHIISLEDGRLWSSDVEEELNNSNENINKFSERAQKAAQAKWAKRHKEKTISDDQNAKHDAKAMLNDAKHDANDMLKHATSNANAMLNDAINNNNNIYNKKTNTIVLAKKEIGSENLETNDLVKEPIKVDALKSQSEQIEAGVENQPPIHEQESVPKKAKQAKANRECQLPADFKPNLQYAVDQGLTHDEALLEFERFKLHWQDNPNRNAKKSDWQKAWYKWITHQEYGLLAKKREKLEREKRYANERYKQPSNNFSSNLAESFSELKAAIYAGDTYGSECSRNTETISSFERTCKEGGPELVSSNLYERKAVDAGGRSANFARL